MHDLTPEDAAAMAVSTVLGNLEGRGGFDHWYDEIHDEIKDEIKVACQQDVLEVWRGETEAQVALRKKRDLAQGYARIALEINPDKHPFGHASTGCVPCKAAAGDEGAIDEVISKLEEVWPS